MHYQSQYLDRLENYLKQDIDNARLRSKIISLSISVGDWERAEAHIADGLRIYPTHAENQKHAGLLCLRKKDYSTAENHFKEAALNGGNDDESLHGLAISCFMQGKHKEVIEIIESAIINSDLQNDLLLLKARSLHHLGSIEKAIYALTEMPKRTAESSGLLSLMLYESNEYSTAIELATLALKKDPLQLESLLARAGSYLENDMVEQAKNDYKTATKSHPNSGRAWLGMGLAQLKESKVDEAEQSLIKAADCMPNHIGTWHSLAWVYLIKKDPISARNAFEESNKIDRNFGETYGGLSVCAAMTGNLTEAEAHAKRAEKLNPNGLSFHYAKLLLSEMKEGASNMAIRREKLLELSNQVLDDITKVSTYRAPTQKVREKVKA